MGSLRRRASGWSISEIVKEHGATLFTFQGRRGALALTFWTIFVS